MVLITKSYLAYAMLEIFHGKYFLAPQIELDDQITSKDNNSVRESSILETSPFHIISTPKKSFRSFHYKLLLLFP